jgi:hypothetical protein
MKEANGVGMKERVGRGGRQEVRVVRKSPRGEKGSTKGAIGPVYQVVVECANEVDQWMLYQQMKEERRRCRLFVL